MKVQALQCRGPRRMTAQHTFLLYRDQEKSTAVLSLLLGLRLQQVMRKSLFLKLVSRPKR
jgi:hypothetical protein